MCAVKRGLTVFHIVKKSLILNGRPLTYEGKGKRELRLSDSVCRYPTGEEDTLKKFTVCVRRGLKPSFPCQQEPQEQYR